MKYSFVMIGEEDFCLTRERRMSIWKDRTAGVREQLEKAWAVGRGNPMSLRIFVMENGNLEATMRTVWTVPESHVYDQWDTERRNFLWIFPLSKILR